MAMFWNWARRSLTDFATLERVSSSLARREIARSVGRGGRCRRHQRRFRGDARSYPDLGSGIGRSGFRLDDDRLARRGVGRIDNRCDLDDLERLLDRGFDRGEVDNLDGLGLRPDRSGRPEGRVVDEDRGGVRRRGLLGGQALPELALVVEETLHDVVMDDGGVTSVSSAPSPMLISSGIMQPPGARAEELSYGAEGRCSIGLSGRYGRNPQALRR